MKLSIIVIGDEILLGQVTDTNSGSISRALAPLGWETQRVLTIGDNPCEIEAALDLCLADSQLVISTGGLGPTKDDLTKETLRAYFGGELHEVPAVSRNIERIFEKRGLRLNEPTRRQAWVPDSCRVVNNAYGTAPCMVFDGRKDNSLYVALPGVPFETEGILADGELVDMIRNHFSPDLHFRHASMMVSGISESALSLHLANFENELPENLHLAYLPTPGLIRLRLDGRGADARALDSLFDDWLERLKRELGDYLVYDGDASAAQICLDRVRRAGLTMATAESCTGGNIAHRITVIPGCSDVFMGSVVSYSNDVKIGVLGVNPMDIENHGAVSEEVVSAMVRGAMHACGATCAVATSGIAGPGGGSPEKPVGTVWMAVGIKKDSRDDIALRAQCFHFPGKRDRVIDRATTQALLMLSSFIERQLCAR